MATARTCVLPALLGALVLPPPSAPGEHDVGPASDLAIVWKADLGPAAERAIYRTAVCADGTSILVDSGGRVVTVSPQGLVLSDHDVLFPGFGSFAATCDAEGAVVVATQDGARTRLTGFRPPARVPVWTHPVREGAFPFGPVHSIVAAGRDRFVLLVGERTGGVRLAFVTPEGAVRHLTPLVRSDVDAIGAAGSLLWDPSRRRTLFVAATEYTIHAHDEEGRLVGSADLRSRLDASVGERAFRAARLPDGRLVVQVWPASPARPGAGGPRVEVLGRGLRPVRVLRGALGPLLGADSRGALYFGGVGAARASIIKATIDGF